MTRRASWMTGWMASGTRAGPWTPLALEMSRDVTLSEPAKGTFEPIATVDPRSERRKMGANLRDSCAVDRVQSVADVDGENDRGKVPSGGGERNHWRVL